MFGFWMCLLAIVLYVFASFLEWLGSFASGKSKRLARLYFLAVPIAILLLPFKLASNMMGGGKRRGRRR